MAYLPVIIVFVLYFSSIPIAYALFGATISYFTFLDATSPAHLVFQRIITSTQSFPLLAIPFFIMAGSIMNYAGISDKLMKFTDVLMGHMTGGLAQVNVLLSLLMGGVSGSANADAAMQSKMLVPEMEKRGYKPSREKAATFGEIMTQLKESIWALLFPFGIIAGLRMGMFTPSEAGAVAVVYCILVGVFIYKELKWEYAWPIMKETIYGTSSVVLIIVAASFFGYYLNWERIPQHITSTMLDFTRNPYMMLMLVNILLLILGMFLEGGAALIILAPLLVPVVTKLGVDPVHFGIICIVNIMIGGLTPPFGSMMFTVCAITETPLGEFFKEVWPFIVALLVALLIVTYVPGLVMFLPNL